MLSSVLLLLLLLLLLAPLWPLVVWLVFFYKCRLRILRRILQENLQSNPTRFHNFVRLFLISLITHHLIE